MFIVRRMFSACAAAPPRRRRVYDVCIVGAGIVGLATARELLHRRSSLSVCLLEKESDIGMHQTKRNSGVLHSGIYYRPGTKQAEYCVTGALEMAKYCMQYNLPYKRVGKLIVAVNEMELQRLRDLFERGLANGVPDLQLIDSDQIRALEPNIVALQAIYSPNTAIVDFHAIAQHISSMITRHHNAVIHRLFEVVHVGKPAHFSFTDDDTKASLYHEIVAASSQKVYARNVVTCSGLHADRIAIASGGQNEPKLIPFRGKFLKIRSSDGPPLVRANVYPTPNPSLPFLEVHITPTISGIYEFTTSLCSRFYCNIVVIIML